MGLFDKLFGKKNNSEQHETSHKKGYEPTGELMEEDLFWKIIQRTHSNSNGDFEVQISELEKELKKMNPEDIMKFDNRFYDFKDMAYNWNLWGAIYLIQGGCSDDSFNDFREWVIGQGKEFYLKTIQNPESLVDVEEDDIMVEWEGLGYVPSTVFKQITGQEMPHTKIELSNPTEDENPRGKEWEDEDLEKMFPKLFAKYGDID